MTTAAQKSMNLGVRTAEEDARLDFIAEQIGLTDDQVVETPEDFFQIQETILHDIAVHYMGNLSIVEKANVCSILMSRPPTDRKGNKLPGGPTSRTYNVERASAEWFANNEITVAVSGMREVDMPAVNAALDHGGAVAVFAPYGINKIYNEKLSKHVESGNLVIISTSLDDDQDWRDGNHELRNQLMVKCSDCLLVPHLDTTYIQSTRSWTGGVMNAIYAADRENVPVWFPQWRRGEHFEMLAILREFPKTCQELNSGSNLDEILSAMFDI